MLNFSDLKCENIRMRRCSVVKNLSIVSGGIGDYKRLACYHYRESRLGPFVAVFALRGAREAVGVIVYAMPIGGLELRNAATGDVFVGFDKKTQMALINRNIRCISRVIIEPRYRGLGLASRLVRETMPKMNVPIVEAMAVMGMVNPFFEKAGMRAYTAPMPRRCVQMTEALSVVGIETNELVDTRGVQQKIGDLKKPESDFIELEIKKFLQGYGRRGKMLAGLERTRFVLSKLTFRPVYYIWFNKEITDGIDYDKFDSFNSAG